MDAAHTKAPSLQPVHQVIEGIPELREQQKALVGSVEETLVLQNALQPVELRLAARFLDRLGVVRELSQLRGLLAHLLRVTGQRDRFQQFFEALALGILQLLELFGVGKVGRG